MPPLEAAGNWDGQEGALRITGDKPTIKFIAGAAGGNQSWLIHVGAGGSFVVFKQGSSPTAWDSVMTLDPAGTVGIGTVTPGARANGKLVSVATGGTGVAAVVGVSDVADAASAGYGGWFESAQGEGVRGVSKNAAHAGVVGVNTGGGAAVYGTSSAAGIHGVSTGFNGVLGETTADGHSGVAGVADRGNSNGVYGRSKFQTGVWGHSVNATGVVAISDTQTGILARGGQLAGRFEGDVEVTGDIRLINADCAEDFDIAGVDIVPPGTVMVFDEKGALKPGDRAYDKRVAGVISGAGGYKPGIVLDRQETQGNRSPVALLGKVFCNVDASYGKVSVGDPLTTSPTAGHAMKADDPLKAFGAVLGKALQALDDGCGLIPVLVSLQ